MARKYSRRRREEIPFEDALTAFLTLFVFALAAYIYIHRQEVFGWLIIILIIGIAAAIGFWVLKLFKGSIPGLVKLEAEIASAFAALYKKKSIPGFGDEEILYMLHCLDGTYDHVDIPPQQQVSIKDRIPVEKVVAPATVKGGQPLNVEIVLSAEAPASNTRVELEWTGNGLSLLGPVPCTMDANTAAAITCHADVGATKTSITLGLQTLVNTGAARQVQITATAKPGVSQQATVSITR